MSSIHTVSLENNNHLVPATAALPTDYERDRPLHNPQETIRRAQEAHRRLAADRTWLDWVLIMPAYVLGRNAAMHTAKKNEPKGRAYCVAFSKWLRVHQLDGIDSTDRRALFLCWANLAEIEPWRAALPLSKRLRLNNPTTVIRHWKATTQPRNHAAAPKISLQNAWAAATEQERRDLLDQLGRRGLCDALSETLRTEIADAIIGLQIANSSASDNLAISLTKMLRKALLTTCESEKLAAVAGMAERLRTNKRDLHAASITLIAPREQKRRAA